MQSAPNVVWYYSFLLVDSLMSAVLGELQMLDLLWNTVLLILLFHLHQQKCAGQHNPTALDFATHILVYLVGLVTLLVSSSSSLFYRLRRSR